MQYKAGICGRMPDALLWQRAGLHGQEWARTMFLSCRETCASNVCPSKPKLESPCPPLQATTNAIFAHFFSLAATLWLLRIVAVGPSAAAAARAAEQASLETPSPA